MSRKRFDYSLTIFIIIFLVSIAAPVNLFKVPPVMFFMMSSLNLSIASAGFMMSVFAIMGIALALPSGFIVHGLGLKRSGIVALGALMIGSFIGWASDNSAQMIISRIIEGVGMCLISVIAPAAIAVWFPPEKRSIPMGIWATWVSAGSILMFLIAPAMNSFWGWKSVWGFSSLYTLVMLFVFILFFRMPDTLNESINEEHGGDDESSFRPYSNTSIWVLAAVFVIFNIMVMAICTFMPSFLEIQRDFTPEKASAVTSLFLVASLIISPVAGYIAYRIKSYKKVILCGIFFASMGVALPFVVSDKMIPFTLILLGSFAAMIAPAAFSAAAEIMKYPSHAGAGMSILAFGQYIGMCVGPALFGELIEHAGWVTAALMLIPIMLTGFVLVLFY